jgi:hypothetical protein
MESRAVWKDGGGAKLGSDPLVGSDLSESPMRPNTTNSERSFDVNSGGRLLLCLHPRTLSILEPRRGIADSSRTLGNRAAALQGFGGRIRCIAQVVCRATGGSGICCETNWLHTYLIL